MSDEITCPDCGGIIGAKPGEGRQVCRCFEPKKATALTAEYDLSSSATLDYSDPRTAPTNRVDAAVGEKVCRVCGRDLKGHRRFKDSRGYVCLPCSDAEQAVGDDHHLIPCSDCGRKLKVDGITTYEGKVVCKQCAAFLKDRDKYKPLDSDTLKKHEEEQKRSFKALLVVAGVLMFFMLISAIKLMWR